MTRRSKLTGEQKLIVQQLVRKISQKQNFGRPRDRELLEYFAGLQEGGSGTKLEKMLADQKTSVGRTAISRLRAALDDYFDNTTDGRREEYRIEIPEGTTPYGIDLVKNRLRLGNVERFWDAHCINRSDEDSILILYTEPLFFWNEKGRYFIRFLDINEELNQPDQLQPKVRIAASKAPVSSELLPSFNYQPGGEIGARNRIAECLRQLKSIQRRSILVEPKPSREFVNDDKVWSMNVVVLGNQRTSLIFKTLQEGCQILIGPQSITSSLKGSQPEYFDGPYVGALQGDDKKRHAYAVVTRRRNRDPSGVVTLIGANHGRAAEKVAEFITDDARLGYFYREHGIAPDCALPEVFQILFRVDILDFDNPYKIEPVLSTLEKGTAPSPTSARVSRRRRTKQAG